MSRAGERGLTVYISIGNSDDKLTQAEWATYLSDVRTTVRVGRVHGEWYSAPDSPWQNACWCVEVQGEDVAWLRAQLTKIRTGYRQDSIAWAPTTGTEFI
jgi:hypothetical protein